MTVIGKFNARKKIFVIVFMIASIFHGLTNIARAETSIFTYPALNSEKNNQTEGESEPGLNQQSLKIYSTADNILMQEILLDFQKLNPTIAIEYHEMQSLEVFQQLKSDMDQGKETVDIAFSSAMDLQMKLANDGYAKALDISLDPALPGWASWRNEAFGITIEPAVILYNKSVLADMTIPRNRTDLAEFLLENRFKLHGKIATYDIEKSGLGYLFFTGDLGQYSAMWELVRIFGLLDIQPIASSSQMINKVAKGELALAYNILGAYALPELNQNPDLGIILPEDYTLVFSRIALVPKNARNPEAGQMFIEYLLSQHGQEKMAENANFSALHPRVKGVFSPQGLYNAADKNVHPLKVSPSLLVYLDQLKRKKIIARWKKLVR